MTSNHAGILGLALNGESLARASGAISEQNGVIAFEQARYERQSRNLSLNITAAAL